jgi:hypothetical protein
MAKLCNDVRVFFRAQPEGRDGISPNPIVTHRLQSLLCCAAPAFFRLKSAPVVDAKQVLTDSGSSASRSMRFACNLLPLPAMKRK